MKPNFLVIGAMKCATSSVCQFLENHPQVFMPPFFEPKFFANDEIFAKGFEWYESHFDSADDRAMIGEGSNIYTFGAIYPAAAQRIAAYRPSMKLVYMVRNPIRRISSAWIQNRQDKRNAIPPSLDLAVDKMYDIYVDPSCYWRNISIYRNHFPDEQIFIGFMEDMQRDPVTFFARLCDFLGIAHDESQSFIHANPSAGKTVPRPVASLMRKAPGADLVAAVLPHSLKARIRSILLDRRVTAPPRMSPEVYARVRAEIEPDARRLLAHCGRPEDFWSLDQP
jgi:hypothetical protein